MRFLIAIILTASTAFSASAQNISVINHYHTFWGNVFDEMGGVSMDVTNNGTSDAVLQAIRTVNMLAPGHESYFCYGIRCYDSSVDTADQYVTVPAGQTVGSTLIHYLKPLGNAGTSEVHYCLIDTANAADSVCVRFIYHATATGLIEIGSGNQSFDLYPNPAKGSVRLAVDKIIETDFIVQVIDVAGKVLLEQGFKRTDDPQLDVSALAEGMYLIQLKDLPYYSKLSVQK